jgi:hypothetical protein
VDRDWALAAFLFVAVWFLLGPVLAAIVALAVFGLLKLVDRR